MRVSPVLAALLCLITWTNFAFATKGPMSRCCPGLSTTRVSLQKIVNYTIQSEGICFVTAVVFHTKLGKKICSDPNSEWTKKAILKVDTKALQEMEQNKQGSTTLSTPAVSNTSRQARGKKGRKWQRNMGKRGKKGQKRLV